MQEDLKIKQYRRAYNEKQVTYPKASLVPVDLPRGTLLIGYFHISK